VREIRLEVKAIGAALRCTGEGRQKAIAIVVQAFSCNKAYAVMNLWSHHVGFNIGVLLLLMS
jgi:hypothetical protein